jgi:NADP-dependent 3-hydroxy acid dehydrogenase YdfG
MPNIVITGASKGIGKAIAEIFVQNHANVCICARNENDLNSTVAELKRVNTTVNIFAKVCDMSVKEEVKAFAEYVLQVFDNVDVLVNNAGVFIGGQMHNEPEGTLEKMIETNLRKFRRMFLSNMKH